MWYESREVAFKNSSRVVTGVSASSTGDISDSSNEVVRNATFIFII